MTRTAELIPFPAQQVAIHQVSIGRAPIGFRAVCICGWSAAGLDKRRLEAMAGSHDLDDEVA